MPAFHKQQFEPSDFEIIKKIKLPILSFYRP